MRAAPLFGGSVSSRLVALLDAFPFWPPRGDHSQCLHLIALDGVWIEQDGELGWEGFGHLRTREVGEVLERLVRRMERHLRRSGQLRTFEDGAEADGEGDPEGNLAASAGLWPGAAGGASVSEPPRPLEPQALAYDKPLCASLDGFTLHAATRAGALDPGGAGGAAALRAATSGRPGAGGAAS